MDEGPRRMEAPSPRLASLAAEYQAAHQRLAERLALHGLPLAEAPAVLEAQLWVGERLRQRLVETRRDIAALRAEIEIRRGQIASREEDLASSAVWLEELRALRARRTEWRTERRRSIALRQRALERVRQRCARLERGDLGSESQAREQRAEALGQKLRECIKLRDSVGAVGLQSAIATLAQRDEQIWSRIRQLRCARSTTVERLLRAVVAPEDRDAPLSWRAVVERARTHIGTLRSEVPALPADETEKTARVCGFAAAVAWSMGEVDGARRWAEIAGDLRRERESVRAGQRKAFETIDDAVRDALADLVGQGARRSWLTGAATGVRAWQRLREVLEDDA